MVVTTQAVTYAGLSSSIAYSYQVEFLRRPPR